MKFLCGSCRTKYQISDDKLQGKILTIRCKKCGAKILVRESLRRDAGPGTAVAPVAEESQAETVAQEAFGRARVAHRAGLGAYASAFEASLSGGGASEDMPTSIAPVPSNLETAGIEWFTAIDGQQQGPFAFAELARQVKGGELLSRHYAWHEGMENWQRVRDVGDLAVYLPEDASTSARRGPPPPPSEAPAAGGTGDRPGATVVDFASRRAERARRSSDRPPDAKARQAASDPVLQTEVEQRSRRPTGLSDQDAAETSDRRAIALSGTAASSAPGAELDLHFDRVDDLFASLPRATDADLVPRESTRFFVAAAGVHKRTSQHKLWLGIGVSLALAVAGFFTAWSTGVIQLSLPGIGNPFAGALSQEELDELAAESGPVDFDALIPGQKRPAKASRSARSRRVLSPSGDPSYIEDSPEAPRDPRGGAEAVDSLDVRFAGNPNQIPEHVGQTRLPTVDPELPPVEEANLSEEAIANVVRSKARSVSICYQQSLRANENLRGKLEIRVTIQPSGRVSRAEIETTAFRGSKIARCIADKIKDWRFPAFSGRSQDVVLPFVLEKQHH